MKKSTVFIILLLILALILAYYQVSGMQAKKRKIAEFNSEYEKYLNKVIYGTDIATLINKAVDNNEQNKIKKDSEGLYIEDNENSVKIELNITTNNTTYKMETIDKVGIVNFVSNFNLVGFKSSNIEYHPNGKISKIIFTQIDE